MNESDQMLCMQFISFSVWTKLLVKIEMSFGTKQSRYWWRNNATIKIETFLNINLASHIIDIFSQLGYKWAFHTSWQKKEGKEMKCFQPNFTCGTLTLHFTIKNRPPIQYYNIHKLFKCWMKNWTFQFLLWE